jgi:hypothetical protein
MLSGSGAESVGYIGGATGGYPGLWGRICRVYRGGDWRDTRDSGAESVRYIGGATGGILRESGAESVRYIWGTDGGMPGTLGLNLSGI